MMENSFSYQYSAKVNAEVQAIRKKYLPKSKSELEQLRELDEKVKRPASVFSAVFGTVGAIVMGSGMSLVMTDIGAAIGVAEPMIPGIVIGIVGMFMTIVNYPIYMEVLGARRRKYAEKIIALSDKLMKG